MALTPVEILHKEFKRSFRGYSDTEVQEFLREVAREHERHVAELARLKEDKQSLLQRLAQFERMEDTLQKTLVMAQQASEDTRKNAQRRADVIIKEAENQRDAIIAGARDRAQETEHEAARVRAQADRFAAELRAMLRAHEELLDQSGKKPRQATAATAPEAANISAEPPLPGERKQNGHDEEMEVVEAAASGSSLINWRGMPHK